jgi:hypothetical protein
MKVNVKINDTGIEEKDWKHFNSVEDVDFVNGMLRIHKQSDGTTIALEDINYFHATEVNE